jgi:hypothetical protein
VSEQTKLFEEEGQAEVGAMVMVIAQEVEGDVPVALTIRVLSPADAVTEVNIRGLVAEYVEGDHLVVNGFTIVLTVDTEIIGTLAVGALVKVEAQLSAGAYTALVIQVLRTEERRQFEFEGVVEAIGAEEWTISGRTFAITEGTAILGDPVVGDTVWVRAVQLPDGALVALRIAKKTETPTPETFAFEGVIQRFPERIIGQWIIGGRTVFVDASTVITGTPALGAQAKVVARMQGRGRIEALSIDIAEPAPQTLTGRIVSLPASRLGRWKINDGQQDWVFVTLPTTKITGRPRVGAMADVTVVRQGQSGVLVATEVIITDDPTDEVTPEPTIPARPQPTRRPPHVFPDPDSDSKA